MQQPAERTISPRQPIAIVRLGNLEEAIHIGQALLEGGITILEFALTNAQAFQAITQVRQALPGSMVGAGTVLDMESAHASIEAGAHFLVTPVFLPDVVTVGQSQGVPVICGAYTPTEIFSAWKAGADFIKVFPAGRLGPAYVKDVLAPLPQIPLVPVGGINLENCTAFLTAGAYTVAIGSNLVNNALVQKKDWETLTALARQYKEACTVEE